MPGDLHQGRRAGGFFGIRLKAISSCDDDGKVKAFMILTILSHIGTVRVLFAIGIALTVLPIFFYIAKIKVGALKKAFPFSICAGIVMIIPMLCYFYNDLMYDVSEFTDADLLYLAVENSNTNVAYTLLKNGADPNGSTRYGVHPLYRAVVLDNAELVRLMLESGGDPNDTGDEDMTMLSAAACNQSCEVAKLLTAAGADGNYMPEKYVSPLHYAGMYDESYNADLVDILIVAGADPSAPAVSEGRVTLPYRWFFDEYTADEDLSEQEQLRYARICERLKPAYLEWLEGAVQRQSVRSGDSE